MATMQYTNTLVIVECANCHIDFAVQRQFDRARQNDHGTFYCPAGHNNFYPQASAAEKLRAELEQEQRRRARLTSQLDQAEAERERARRRVIAMKGVVTKTKNRIAAGKCVRCSAEFPDLAEHMADAHPDYTPAA